MITPGVMNKVRETIRCLEGKGVDLSAATHASIVALLDEGTCLLSNIPNGKYAAMILSVARGHTTDEDVQWHVKIRR